MSRPDDSLEDVILAGVDGRLLDLHTQLRGNVVAYDESAKTCEIKIGTKVAVPDGEGDFVYQAIPNLTHVPVAWPSAGGFLLHWPLTAGDSVFVTFDEQDSQRWEASGNVSEPGWLERFGLSSALAHPYSRQTVATSGACMVCPSAFSFGDSAAAKALTRDDLLHTLISNLVSWIQSGNAPSGGGPVVYAPFSAPATAASKVKSE